MAGKRWDYESESTNIRSWVNGVRSIGGGTHVKGLQNALRSAKCKPLVALVHVIMLDPYYAGPVRAELVNPEAAMAVEHVVRDGLASIPAEELF